MYTIDGKLKVAVSSRALFQLEKEDEIFLTKGKKAYEQYQVKHEKDILQPGAAFPVVKALLELGKTMWKSLLYQEIQQIQVLEFSILSRRMDSISVGGSLPEAKVLSII